MENTQKYVTKLEEYLKENGIRQNHFCKKVGVVDATLCRLRRGECTPSLPTAYEIEKETKGFVKMTDWLPDDFVQKYNLNSRINPKMIELNNSSIGKTLNLYQGRGTTEHLDSPSAYINSFEKSVIGNYTVGYHFMAIDPTQNDPQYVPNICVKDNTTGKIYPSTELNWELLSKYPGISKSTQNYLSSKNSTTDKTEILHSIQEIKDSFNKLSDPNKAIKLLLNNSDKK